MTIDGMDLEPGEAEAALESFRRDPKKRDGRICACGHPMTRHGEVDLSARGRGVVTKCVPTRMSCPCEDPKPVVEASDTRPFLHKTKGAGAAHALSLGIAALNAKGREWGWAEGWPRCELGRWEAAGCESAQGVRPYPVSGEARRLSESPEAVTWLLCRAHAAAIREGAWPA